MSESANPSQSSVCPTCGAALSDAAGGMCPRCLMAGAMDPTKGPGSGVGHAAPPLEDVVAAFPQFEIIEMIGAGGMGTVWRARQPKLHREVALKLLPASLAERDPAFAERFEREGQLLARLHHPNIVTVHDSGRASDFFYLVMELVDGVNLRQAMRASRFTAAQALAIVPKICEALQYAHEEGVLHRDIKPENILLDNRGRVKLVDFGIAKLVAQPESAPGGAASTAIGSLTQSDATLGTPNYMAPEQIDRPAEVDHRADIYSLGVVFYELLTGELPLGKFAPPSQKSASDPRLDGIVQQALEKERGRRQQSVDEMRTQVESIAGLPGATTSAQTPAPRFSPTVVVGLLGAILVMDVAIWLTVGNLWKHNPPEASQPIGRWLLEHEFVVPLFALVLIGIVDWLIVCALFRKVDPGSSSTDNPPSLPRRDVARPAIWPTALLHGLLMAAVCAAFVFVVPRYVEIFRDLGLRLPLLTQLVCDISDALRRGAIVLLPVVVAADVGLCFLLRAAGGRVGLRAWTATVVAAWLLIGVVAGVVLQLPMNHAMQAVGQSSASGAVFFGPVIERVLPFDLSTIDFQQGVVRQPDWQAIHSLPGDGYGRWLKETGTDALVEELDPLGSQRPSDAATFPRLTSPMRNQEGEKERCEFVREETESFESVRPEDADARLKVITEKKISWNIAYGPRPYWFQTLDGAKGVVQIVGASEQPRGLKIRYKLVVSDRALAVSPPGSLRVAMLPKLQIERSEAAVQRLKAKAASLEAAGGAEWEVAKQKAAALEGALQRCTAEWSKFETVLTRHRASGVTQGEWGKAQSAIGTAEVRLRMAQVVTEGSASGLALSLAVERFIPANDEAPYPWFDIDAGRLITAFGDEERTDDFCASAVAGHRGLSTAEETGFGTVALGAAAWESMTVAALTEQLKSATVDGARADGPLPATYGFTTRSGGLGMLQIVSAGEGPRGLKIRYKMLTQAGLVVTAQGDGATGVGDYAELETGPVTLEVKDPASQSIAPVADTPASAVLGPIAERVVGDIQTSRENCALSFDSGKLIPAGGQVTFATLTDPTLQPVAIMWAQENQVDAVGFVTMNGDKAGKCGLLCPGLVVLPIRDPKFVWDSVTPDELKAEFEKRMHEWGFISQIAELKTDGEFPASFMILDTRTRRRGVLQITGVGEQPRSVKIRYRLVEAAPVKKTAQLKAGEGKSGAAETAVVPPLDGK